MALGNLNKWAFFYFSPGFSPQNNTTISRNQSGNCEIIMIGFDPAAKQNSSILDCAKKLTAEGVQFIELCGGFGPAWVTKINEVLNYQIPVGTVTYGPEFRKQLYEIMQ